MSEQWERNLQRVVRRIALEQADGERILRQHMMRRQALIRRRYSGAAVSFCLFWLLAACLFWLRPLGSETGAVVYAATGEAEWTKLEIGQRQKLLKMESETAGFVSVGEEAFCIFQLKLPERYLFEQEGAVMGRDLIGIREENIYWYVFEQEPYGDRSCMRIRIVDEDGKRVDTLELIMTREGEECYAQLERVS